MEVCPVMLATYTLNNRESGGRELLMDEAAFEVMTWEYIIIFWMVWYWLALQKIL